MNGATAEGRDGRGARRPRGATAEGRDGRGARLPRGATAEGRDLPTFPLTRVVPQEEVGAGGFDSHVGQGHRNYCRVRIPGGIYVVSKNS